MAVMKDKSGNNLFVDCMCGCNEGIRIGIDKDDYNCYSFLCFTNGYFFTEQSETMWEVFYKKLRKILAIIRNKDYYYSEICMTKDDFEEFKEYINSIK